jgi:hypothetical protein
MNTEENTSTRDLFFSQPWVISLLITCLLILSYCFINSNPKSNDIPYLLGYNLPLTLILWFIFYIFISRKKGIKKNSIFFISILLSFMIGDLVAYSRQKKDAKVFISELRSDVQDLKESLLDNNGKPKRAGPYLDDSKKIYGDIGIVQSCMKNFLNDYISFRNSYFDELNDIGWQNILNTQRISEDSNLLESRLMINKAKGIVIKKREQLNSLFKEELLEISKLEVSEEIKIEMANGFERGVQDSRTQMDMLWNLEEKAIEKFENIFTLLLQRQGKWIVKGEKILFIEKSDSDKFNGFLTDIQAIVKKQQSMQSQSFDVLNAKLKSLENDARLK